MAAQADIEARHVASAVEETAQKIGCGPVSALIVNGAIRNLCFDGVEVIRGVDCPVRDANWGTAVPEKVQERLVERDAEVDYERSFTVFEGKLKVALNARFLPDGARFDLKLSAGDAVQTNRAGFTLLHPLDGVSGHELIVLHSDGQQEETTFPEAIMAGQPAFDIAGLRHTVHGVHVDIRMSGEIFEMEDQRNWTDASFKTYCRPLSLPFPYTIARGDTVRQSIEIRLSGRAEQVSARGALRSVVKTLPSVALAVSPPWLSGFETVPGGKQPPVTKLVRLDMANDDLAAAAGAIAKLEGPIELELIVDDSGEIGRSIETLSALLGKASTKATSVVALPRAFLKSYQPNGPWPDGYGLAEAMKAAAQGFPGAQIGSGMLTNFTEFNRHPPPSGSGDFVTYATTAIVHAADDRSVFETLEALSHVHASAQALAGDRPLRLGLASIGMRSNPYGESVAANPDLQRIAMAMDDPRQRTVFGAAFAVGAYTVAANCGIERIALAGLGGPFSMGAVEGDHFVAWPVYHVVCALSFLSKGKPFKAPASPPGVFGLMASVEGSLNGVFANCSLRDATLALPGMAAIVMDEDCVVADPQWLDHAKPIGADALHLGPGSVAFVRGEDG